MNDKISEERILAVNALEMVSNKKIWVTPVVSESPVNELTDSGFTGVGADNGTYS